MKYLDAGIGDFKGHFKVYIANRPPIPPFDNLDNIVAAKPAMLQSIGQQCGNGWRKVFNVYAKLLYALDFNSIKQGFNCWQDYRDLALLQSSSDTLLLFSAPDFSAVADSEGEAVGEGDPVHIIMGKHYGLSLSLPEDLLWLDNEFAISVSRRCIICPYFDYRQLSNIKIVRLVELINQLQQVSQVS